MDKDLLALIARALGADQLRAHGDYRLPDTTVLAESAQSLMRAVEPIPGACLHLSATWALHLRDVRGIPAVAVAGDLKVADRWVFRGAAALPKTAASGQVIRSSWKGHCWMEIDGLLCDLSIFRTAYALSPESDFRRFIEGTFGNGRGALICRPADLPVGLRYRRQFVLSEREMVALARGQEYMIKHGAKHVVRPGSGNDVL